MLSERQMLFLLLLVPHRAGPEEEERTLKSSPSRRPASREGANAIFHSIPYWPLGLLRLLCVSMIGFVHDCV